MTDLAMALGERVVTLPLRIDGPAQSLRAAFAHVPGAAFGGAQAEVEVEALLHPREMAVLAGLRAPRRRRSYLLGRCAAKAALSELLGGVERARIEIVSGVLDQPVVRGGGPEPVDVSITHSDARACALAFPAAMPMGLDVEELDPERAAVMESQLAQAERAMVRAVTHSDLLGFTLVWTAKEALSKALRCGLTVPFDVLALDRIEVGPWGFTGRFRNFGQYAFHVWTRPGWVLSLVLPLHCHLRTDLGAALAGDDA